MLCMTRGGWRMERIKKNKAGGGGWEMLWMKNAFFGSGEASNKKKKRKILPHQIWEKSISSHHFLSSVDFFMHRGVSFWTPHSDLILILSLLALSDLCLSVQSLLRIHLCMYIYLYIYPTIHIRRSSWVMIIRVMCGGTCRGTCITHSTPEKSRFEGKGIYYKKNSMNIRWIIRFKGIILSSLPSSRQFKSHRTGWEGETLWGNILLHD